MTASTYGTVIGMADAAEGVVVAVAAAGGDKVVFATGVVPAGKRTDVIRTRSGR